MSGAETGTQLSAETGRSSFPPPLLSLSLLQDINPGTGSSDPYHLAQVNDMRIVAADDGTHGLELLGGPMPRLPRPPGSVRAPNA